MLRGVLIMIMIMIMMVMMIIMVIMMIVTGIHDCVYQGFVMLTCGPRAHLFVSG